MNSANAEPAMEETAAACDSANNEALAEADSVAVELDWAVRLLRVAACAIILYQSVYFALALNARSNSPHEVALLHFFNITAGYVALALTFAPHGWLHRRWMMVAFGMCAAVTTGMTAITLLADNHMQFFIAMLLFALGTGAVVPWPPQWQFAFNLVAIVEFEIVFGWIHDYRNASRWLGIITAAGLSQSATVINQRFRDALRAQMLMLRQGRERLRAEMAERERAEHKLRENESLLRRTFDAAPDPILIVRLGDAALIEANDAFQTTGFKREEAIGRTIGELDVWARPEQREEYRRRLARDGIVRNMEVEWRHKDGGIIPALLSGAAIELNGEVRAVTLMRDISRIKQTENELIAAREAALAASRSKSEFLSSMSHEIRTPLNAILGMAELLGETALNSRQRGYLDVMRNNGNALLNLINDILDLAKVETGRLSLERTRFDLDSFMDRLGETLGVRAHTKGIELIIRIASGTPLNLIGDVLRLRKILINLVGNAIKFTEHGEVIVTVERRSGGSPGSLHFAIADTGIGIPAHKLDQIFSAFTQGDSSLARKYGGSGLGLAIVRRLAHLMNGRVWAESKIGVGSTFHFTADFGLQDKMPTRDSGSRPKLAGMRALIVDDNVAVRALVAGMLLECGATVSEAAGGRQALDEVASADRQGAPYRLLVVDARMPGMGGFQLARELKRRTRPAIVMMLTPDGLNLQLRRERELGLDAYLVKPVRRAALFGAITTAIASSPGAAAVPAIVNGPCQDEPGFERSLRILLVKDSPDNRLVIRAYLKKMPHEIDEAENGDVAFRKFTASRYDLVLMDLQMPVTDGLTAAQMIRQWENDHSVRRTPIIALTASALEEDVRKSFAAGMDAHVSKPVKKAVLIDAIHAAMRGAAADTALSTAAD